MSVSNVNSASSIYLLLLQQQQQQLQQQQNAAAPTDATQPTTGTVTPSVSQATSPGQTSLATVLMSVQAGDASGGSADAGQQGSTFAQDLTSLIGAIQSGNSANVQADVATLRNDLDGASQTTQAAPTGGHHHHHHGGGGVQATQSTTASIVTPDMTSSDGSDASTTVTL